MLRCLAAGLLYPGHLASGRELSVVLPTARRFLHSSPVVAMGHGSHSSDNNPEVLEREKQRSLTGECTPDTVNDLQHPHSGIT